ncbi:MAG TPA: hypothetical protein VIH69_06525 [Dehalococcoidia bacterium]
MPKKSRRAKAKQRTRVAKAAQEGRLQQLGPMPAELQSLTQVSPKAQELTSRYQYVMPEIKRIGIIAGAIIVVLIILSFVLG